MKPENATKAGSKSESAPSPCIAVCHIDGRTGFCLGCYRTLPEIAQWHKKTEAERWAVLAELDSRKSEDEDKENQSPA
ncbi:MAG: DUF1289 domain-containing protein [Proteobacteria bacterium]|nr:DUF1289 domain-containing protein [Pseudomonadota bacterium]